MGLNKFPVKKTKLGGVGSEGGLVKDQNFTDFFSAPFPLDQIPKVLFIGSFPFQQLIRFGMGGLSKVLSHA